MEQVRTAERITPVAADSIKASRDQDLAIGKQGSGVPSAASGERDSRRPRFGKEGREQVVSASWRCSADE